MDGLKLDRGEFAEASLAPAVVVGPFDPGDDREAEFLARCPLSPVEDVLLQEREEGLHCVVVSGLCDAAHGSDQSVVAQGHGELLGPELAASVAMNDRAGWAAPQHDRHPQRLDGQFRGHP